MKLPKLSRREWAMAAAIGFLAAMLIGFMIALWLPIVADLAGWAGLASAVAAFLAIGLGYIGFVETTRNNRREYSAYLRAAANRARFSDNILKVDIEIENYGRTPAKVVVFSTTAQIIYISENTLGEHIAHADEIPRMAKLELEFLHPGKPSNVAITFDVPFVDKDARAVEAGSGIVALGYVTTFKDVFGSRHVERDSWFYSGAMVLVPGSDLKPTIFS